MVQVKPHHEAIAREILASGRAEQQLARIVAQIIATIDARQRPADHEMQLLKLFSLLGVPE